MYTICIYDMNSNKLFGVYSSEKEAADAINGKPGRYLERISFLYTEEVIEKEIEIP